MDFYELNKFDAAALSNPESFFWPGYLWFWNDTLTKEKIFRQLHEMISVGAKNLWVIPVPTKLRPNSMKTNLEPEYLSEEYLDLYKQMLTEMKRLGMKLWLYDEGGWPSGSVCGRIVGDNPSWARQSLIREETKIDLVETIRIPDDSIAAFLYKDDTIIKRLKPGENIDAKEFQNEIQEKSHDLKVEIYYAKKGIETFLMPPYPDLLNPMVTREFIRLTHEAYKKVLGEYFGSTITLVVSDEPKVDNPPWTYDFEITFMKEKGYDIREFLPAIFQESEENAQVRIDFFDVWSKQFSEVFLGAIQQWCHKNNLLYFGHVAGNSMTIGSQTYGFGHIMRALRKFDIPGVDAIWKQIYPGKKEIIKVKWDYTDSEGTFPICGNHHFPKYASSVAHQNDKKWSGMESFSAYGSALTIEDMKWITDFQFVRGINILIAGEMHLSTKGHYMGSMRPIFCKENPLFPHMGVYHSYAARLSYLLSLGSPAIETALYLPVRDIWAGGSELEIVAGSNDTLARILLENQCDFDMIDDDLLEDTSTTFQNGYLQTGPMKYKTLYVSRTRHISGKSRENIERFIKSGGKVYWVDNRNVSAAPEGSIEVELEALSKQYIDPIIGIKPENKAIRVCKRILDNGNLYFITNEDLSGNLNVDLKEADCIVQFKEIKPIIGIEPETGKLYKPVNASYSDGIWSLPLDLKFAGSYVFLFSADNIPLNEEHLKCAERYKLIGKNWSCRKIKEFRIGDEEFEVHKDLDEQSMPILLGDWRGFLGNDFSGDVEYSVEFECSKKEAKSAFELDLGLVKGVAEVVLNGVRLGKRAWQPFVFNLKQAVLEGRNSLKVVVTNTMANQFVESNRIAKWPDNVIGFYHKQCLAMEKGHTNSGLYGPVKISF